MNKRFLFINSAIDSGYRGVNHGIAFLVPILKKHSYDVACLNIQHEISSECLRGEVESINPSIVGFSCTSHQLKYLVKYSRELEGYSKALQIAGGTASTLMHDWIMSKSAIKGFCVGEGEIPLENLLNKLDKGEDITDTEGFYWNVNGYIKRNPIPQYLSDLSNLAFPDYSIFDRQFVIGSNTLNIMLGRGCPYNCHYCCNSALGGVYPTRKGYFRLPSVEYSMELLESMIKKYPDTHFIGFEDDCLIANSAWFRDFAEQYQHKIKIPYRMGVRPECITPQIVTMMKASGCCRADIGLESGNEALRNNLLNRHYSNDLFIEKCNLIKSSNVHLVTFNIVGFPSESRKAMEDTLKLNKKVSANGGVCTFFYPYHGTELYNICRDRNVLKSDDDLIETTNYNTRPSIKMSKTQEQTCLMMQRKIKHYLEKQNRNAYLVDMVNAFSPKIGKPITIICYFIIPILTNVPILFRIVGKLYKILYGGREKRRRTFY